MGAVLLVTRRTSLRGAQGVLAHPASVKGQVMKNVKIGTMGAMVALALVAGPANAAGCTDAATCIAEVGTSMTTNTGLTLGAIAASAASAIGLAYLSGMIKTAMGWGKSKK